MEESAVSETEEKYGALCRSVAGRILGSAEDAEECVNDALHQAWTAIPPQRPDRLGAWLGKVTRNLALNAWKRDRTRKRQGGMTALLDELAECVPGPVTVERELERKELAAAIDSWLRGRSKEDRTLFLRRYWYGQRVDRVAAQAGCSPNSMAKRLGRLRNGLRRSLKQTLEKEGYL